MRLALLPACLLLASLLPGLAAAQDGAATESEDEAILEEHADERETAPPAEDEPEELPAIYSALGVQKLGTDIEGVTDAVNLDITVVGFRVPTVPWFGIELNLSTTFIPGEVRESATTPGSEDCVIPPFIGCTSSGGETITAEDNYGVNALGIYLVGRSPGKFFATGKLGYRYIDTNLFDLDEKTGNAWSIGGGYRWKDDGSYVELLYTKLSDEFDALGFGISYSYDRDW